MSSVGALCLGVGLPIGFMMLAAWCLAPVAHLFGVTGKRRGKKKKTQGRQEIGPREVICLTLVIILLAISLANGTMSAMISSVLSK
jgi:hypothetical protein